MGTDIEEIEARVRGFLKTEYRTDALYRVAVVISQIGDIAKFVYHSPENNPNARSVGTREDEISIYGEAMVHLIALMISRGIDAIDSIEAGFERLEDKDGYKRDCQLFERDGETVIKGESGSPGVAQGTALVIPFVSEAKIKKLPKAMAEEECILVTGSLNPDSFSYLDKIRLIAIITDQGGRTSHAVMFARGLGIPCVPGTSVATKEIESGDFVLVDGERKEVVFRHRELRK